MSKRRTIRGVQGDRVKIWHDDGVLYVQTIDYVGNSCVTDGDGLNASVIVGLPTAAAKQLHTALGELLAATKTKRKARRR